MKIQNKKEIFAFCFNITLVILTVFGITLFFAGGDWKQIKYYTLESNFLLAISCIISIIYILLKWNGKIKTIPLWVDIVKLTATATVTLTMFITLFFLLPFALFMHSMDPKILYTEGNLIYHLINPIIAIVTFILFENRKDIKLTKTLYCLIPTIAYAIVYICMAYTHIGSDGLPIKEYDWYGFCSFGPIVAPFMCIGVVGFYYLFTWLLWLGNRKINIKSLA